MFKARLKQKKIVLLSIYICIIIILAFGILSCSKKEKIKTETFSFHGQTVKLLSDGNFTASLAHGVKKSGTYTKTTDNERIIISFNVKGNVAVGMIINNFLHLPKEWDDGHSHGNIFPKGK